MHRSITFERATVPETGGGDELIYRRRGGVPIPRGPCGFRFAIVNSGRCRSGRPQGNQVISIGFESDER